MPTRILVVNDTEDILEAFRMLLTDAGYEPILFSYAPKTIGEIERAKPDLIILDLMFGEEKLGWDLLQIIKMHRTTADIPIIICTAAVRETQIQDGYLRSLGVQVILKPFDIEILLQTIQQSLDARRGKGEPPTKLRRAPQE